LVIHSVCTTKHTAGIGVALGMLKDPLREKNVGVQILSSVKDIFAHPACFKRETNDAKTFKRTALLLMTPTAPPANLSDTVFGLYAGQMDDFAKEFELSAASKVEAKNMSALRLEMLSLIDAKAKLVQTYKRQWKTKKVTCEMKIQFEEWLFTLCDVLYALPNKKDVKTVIDTISGEKVTKRVWHYTFLQREI
jgi:hypothetical protein